MPKGRYVIMRNYMPKVGGLGLDMMLRTCTVQANLDFSSEADMVAKFRMSLALQPIATALFANSPFTEGKPNGFLSARANVWTDTDADRTGLLDFVFEDGFDFERYARYALDVPMYFAKRGDKYIDLAGRSFRDFIDGKLDELPGERASIKDWADHTTTLFPEVRLKTVPGDARRRRRAVEPAVRPAGPVDRHVLRRRGAWPRAWDLCKDWTAEDRDGAAPRRAPAGPEGRRSPGARSRTWPRTSWPSPSQGLKSRAQLNGGFLDETTYLGDLEEIADSGAHPGRAAARRCITAPGRATSTGCSRTSPTRGGHRARSAEDRADRRAMIPIQATEAGRHGRQPPQAG